MRILELLCLLVMFFLKILFEVGVNYGVGIILLF